MVITKIERLRSHQARYRIRFDDRDPILLSEDLLVKFSLAQGDEITEETYSAVSEAEQSASAKQAAYRYISYRPRSAAETRMYLLRKGFSGEQADRTILSMTRLGLIDDESFAAMVTRDAVSRGNTGPLGIRKKLGQKGIRKEIIQRLLGEYFTDELQRERAVELLKKRIRRTERSLKKLQPAQRRARLFQFLAQRGFSGDAARHALKQIEV